MILEQWDIGHYVLESGNQGTKIIASFVQFVPQYACLKKIRIIYIQHLFNDANAVYTIRGKNLHERNWLRADPNQLEGK